MKKQNASFRFIVRDFSSGEELYFDSKINIFHDFLLQAKSEIIDILLNNHVKDGEYEIFAIGIDDDRETNHLKCKKIGKEIKFDPADFLPHDM